jgi:hypothetical protein
MISGDQCLAVLRRVALSVIEDVRSDDDEYVLTYRGELVARMLNSAWIKAGKHTGLGKLRTHDPKHTIERQLRVTTNHCAAKLTKLRDVQRMRVSLTTK